MATLYSSLGFIQKPVAGELEPEVATRSPTYASPVGSELDGSSESDSEVLLSLFAPEPPSSSSSRSPSRSPTTIDLSDRGGRPFPYTRSKTRWQARPNDELKYLRMQVVELEALLAALSHSDTRSRLLQYREDAGDNNQAEALQRLREESHTRKMNAAMMENRKLRAMVASQFQVAKALQTALDEHHCRKFEVHDCYSHAVTVDNVELPGALPAEIKGRHFLWSVDKGDRTVINWSSFNEYDDGNRHVRLLKRLWFALEPISFDKNCMAQPGKVQGCILRTVVRYTPVDPDLDTTIVEDMADIIIAGYKRDSPSGSSNSPTSERFDRVGRPFPYTRSKTRWRKRPTDELKYLRSQVAELEKLLASLNCADGRTKLLGSGEDAGTANQTLRKLREESHRKKLKAGLAENRRLRSMILTQFQVANALQTVIDDHRKLRTQKMSWPSQADVSDRIIFSLLDGEKEHQYADHNEVRMLPFQVADVARSLRNCLSHGSPDAELADVKSRVLQLCIPQGERTVVVWSGYAEYSGSKFIRLLEKTYISLEAIPMEKLGMFTMGGRSPGTMMRLAVRLTPVETEYDVQKSEDFEEMADVVVRTYQRTGQRMFQAMLEQLKVSM
ncbi:Retinol dehydrogenase 14 [Phytophthora cinnamomi]|uniref:Retinol dehydrogenase 14 n=1 Tax=Phytophthora cinnamomi TaxID=4785 RepID=UPI003559DBBE|nr:Retinol dehydrogenase 14 [Phytophthora cinnamomi]